LGAIKLLYITTNPATREKVNGKRKNFGFGGVRTH
jgi:hypothetical protein